MKAGEVLFIAGLLITCGVATPMEPSSIIQIVAVAVTGLGLMALGVRLMYSPSRETYFHERL